jgi:uncharacterized protein (TIGR00290 family)
VTRPKAVVAWSSGKDSAWTLYRLRQEGAVEVVGLMTTLGAASGTVAMHGTPAALVRAQAEAAGLPLHEVAIPEPCPDEAYEAAMRGALARLLADGVSRIAFGDLFLAEIRAYRERRLAGTGVTPLFPLWGEPTAALAQAMVAGGLRAIVAAVDTARLDAGFLGRAWDESLIAALPPDVDPCGEHGEFHTLACAGPMFRAPIPLARGAVTHAGAFAHLALAAAPP